MRSVTWFWWTVQLCWWHWQHTHTPHTHSLKWRNNRGSGNNWEQEVRWWQGGGGAYLAAFAGDHPVVDPWGFISTDLTGDDFNLSCRHTERTQCQNHTLLTSTHSSTHSPHPHTCQQLQQVQHSSWFCLLKDRQAAEPQERWRSSAASSSHINHDYNKLITLDISPSCFIWYFIDKKSDFCPGGKIQFNNRTHFFSFHISFIVQADTHTDIDQWSTTLSWSDRLICTSCTQHPSKHWEKRIMHKNSTNK